MYVLSSMEPNGLVTNKKDSAYSPSLFEDFHVNTILLGNFFFRNSSEPPTPVFRKAFFCWPVGRIPKRARSCFCKTVCRRW